MRITEAEPSGPEPDPRGTSRTLPPAVLARLADVRDVHVAEIRPGALRGNHFHERKREVIVLVHNDACSVHWDEGEGTEPQSQRFSGTGVVCLEIEPGVSHAIRNDGQAPVWIYAFCDQPYDPAAPDAVIRRVV